MHLTPDGLYSFESPRTVSACDAVTLGDAMDSCPSDPKKIIAELRVDWGHTSAKRLGKKVSADSDGEMTHSVNYVDEVLGRCDI